ncbi:MAG: mechanosensitive ion channel family protein [Vicinamibacterales bacterium]
MQSAADPFKLPPNSLELVLALALVLTAATAAALTAGSLTRRLLANIHGNRFQSEPFVRATARIVRRMVFALVTLVLMFPALDLAGLNLEVGLHGQDLARWISNAGLRVALIGVVAFAATRLAASVVSRAELEMAHGGGVHAAERLRRAQTLGGTFRRFLSALVWTTAVLMMLREMDVDITPVLTGAGILGLAIGFGAQTLVKDVISGAFIIAEDQVRVGDFAVVNGVGGFVEEINLRTIVLRDSEGIVYTIANGEIRSLANRTKDFSYYVITLGIEYEDDTDEIVTTIRETGDALMKDPAFAPSILEPVDVMGVDDFQASQVTIQFRIKTLPLKQWEVGRELRRRIKKAFDVRGIRMPSPKMEVTLRDEREEARNRQLPDTER